MQSEDTGAFLLYIGEKYNLNDDKTSSLSKIVGDVVLGIVPITSLAQEINSKITSDAQAAMNLAQELNTELLAPVMTGPSIPSMPAKPAIPPAPAAPIAPAPTPASLSPRPIAPPTAPTSVKPADKYREPTSSGPEVVDLRKTPPISAPEPIPKPTTPIPKPVMPTPPLTFTRPIEPIKPAPQPPLIEAEPHQIPAPESRPQYIMRPSGAPPTDLPHDVLDLRRDKGEF